MPLVVLAVSLFFLVGGTLGGALANALHVNVLSVSPSWQSTLSIAHNVYSSSPVFGSGPGTFGIDWLTYRDASLNSTVFWNTNFSSGIGFIPTSFVTTGLIGVLAWVVFLGLFIVLGLRMLIARAPQDEFIRYSRDTFVHCDIVSLHYCVVRFAERRYSCSRVCIRGTLRFNNAIRRTHAVSGALCSQGSRGSDSLLYFCSRFFCSRSVFAAYTLVEHSIAVD